MTSSPEEFQNTQIGKPKAGSSQRFQMEHAQTQPNESRQITNPNAEPVLNHGIAEFDENEVWPLSGKPYFHVVIGKAQLKQWYQVYIPVKVHRLLPSAVVPVILTYCGKNWVLSYIGNRRNKGFGADWKHFVVDNDLKLGDVCVFELVKCSSANLKFRVQILRGDFPAELLARVKGETSNSPVVIE